MTTVRLQVPLSKQSFIIGTGGTTIHNIQTVCSVSVMVPKKEENVTTVSIVGSAEGIQKAQEMIEEIVQLKLSSDPLKEVVLVIPTNKHSILIGTKGANKKTIEKESNVILVLPARESNSTDVQIIGNEVSIEKAKLHIAQLIKIPITVKGDAIEQKIAVAPILAKKPLKDAKQVLIFSGEEANDKKNFNIFLEYLGSATKTIDICVYTISDDEISRVILALHKSGIKVRIITDDDCSLQLGSDIAEFHQNGIPVRMDNSPAHMHHKFAILDSTCIINGSFNWTRQAHEKNKENVLILSDSFIVKEFNTEFEKMWLEYKNNPLKFA